MFIKIGKLVLNPAHITCVNLDAADPDGKRCVRVNTSDDGMFRFYDAEAELLRMWFINNSTDIPRA